VMPFEEHSAARSVHLFWSWAIHFRIVGKQIGFIPRPTPPPRPHPENRASELAHTGKGAPVGQGSCEIVNNPSRTTSRSLAGFQLITYDRLAVTPTAAMLQRWLCWAHTFLPWQLTMRMF